MAYGTTTRKNAQQDWTVGAQVRVGFLTLTVRAPLASGAFVLSNTAGTQLYHFRPHHGCEKVGPIAAQALMAEREEAAARATFRALTQAAADARKSGSIDALFAR